MKTATQTEAVALIPEQPMQVARPIPTPIELLQGVLQGGVTADSAAAVKELVGLMERMEDRNAEKEFSAGFVALQSELPVIVAKTVIPNRGKYERFEDLMTVVGPLLTKHGFTVSFSMDFKENRILETCHLTHKGGHTRSNSFAVRGGRADTDTQADCKAATTAKRNALCNALNIVIRQDCLNNEEDAGIEGDPNAKVTPEQAFELERRAKELNSNIPAFLQLAKAKTFADIPANQYDNLDQMLRRKAAKSK
jgi:hypothetical protein